MLKKPTYEALENQIAELKKQNENLQLNYSNLINKKENKVDELIIKKESDAKLLMHQKAEKLLEQRQPVEAPPQSQREVLKLIHELQAFQIELEMQNEELQLAIEKCKTAVAIYDFAPAGYITLDNYGTIYELNFSAANLLGKERSALVENNFKLFISKETLPVFNSFLQKVFDTSTKQTCEVMLTAKSAKTIFVHIEGIISSQKQKCLLTVFDVSKRKQLELELIAAKEIAERNELQLNAILEKSPTGFAINKISTGEVSYVNKAFADAYHVPIELCSKVSTFFDYVYGDQMEIGNKILNDVKSGVPEQMNWQKVPITDKVTNTTHYVSASNIILEELDLMISTVMDITSQVENEKDLKLAKVKAEENEAKFHELFSNVNDAIFIYNPDNFEILEANKATSEIYGYGQDELIGMSCLKFSAEVEKSKSVIKLLIDKGQKVNVRFRHHKKKDGTDVFVELSTFNIFVNGKSIFYSVSHNITDIRKSEIELLKAKEKAEENEKLYKDLVQSSQNLIWKCDLEGNFIFLNSAWENTHGYKIEEMLGRPFSDFQRPEVFERDVVEFTKHLEGGSVNGYETTHITKVGTEITLIFNALPLFNAFGEIIGTQGTAFDISKLKKSELELLKAKEKAEESDRLKSAFLANMSHEIRTPMNGILGFAEVLKEPGLTSDQQHEYLEIIERSGIRMLSIINDIVDISKIESGQMTVKITETNINDQIDFVHSFFKQEVELKGIRLSVIKSLSSAEAIIHTDREKLYSILTNLVKNAIKYSNEGSIEFGYSLKHAQLEFFVKDTGIGIRRDRQEAIFERFIQAEIVDKLARQGAGLGLAITKAYIEMLGGEIWVESEEGQGSTFYFTLPYKTESIEEKDTKIALLTPEDENQIKKLKILIVEDDEPSEKLITIGVGKFSSEIIIAKTGTEAVENCRRNPDIDLVLMDIQMPEMDGYEATRQIRHFNKKVIIIAQTAYALGGDREKALEAGCTDYISKPIKRADLMELINKYFKN